jgi:hypothetical protein
MVCVGIRGIEKVKGEFVRYVGQLVAWQTDTRGDGNNKDAQSLSGELGLFRDQRNFDVYLVISASYVCDHLIIADDS